MLTRLAALFLIADATLNAQVPGSIAGTVTDASTHRPIHRAQISLANRPDVVTAEDGSFTIRDLASADAHFLVSAPGYRSIDETVIPTPAGVMRHDWELRPMGRLTVRLADADTGAALSLTVSLRPRTLYATGGAKTNTGQKGETEFINLEPGDYIVEVAGAEPAPEFVERAAPDRATRPKSYGPVWYPGVPELNMAEVVHLEDGERRSLDLRIHGRETFRAEGTIAIPQSREHEAVALRLGSFQSRVATAMSASPRNSFRVEKLLPGRYAVAAMIGNPTDWEYGRLDFEITDRDAVGLKLAFRPMAHLFGTVLMAEDGVALPASLTAFLVPDDGWSALVPPFQGARAAIPVEAERFHASGLIPTDYGAMLRGLPNGYAVADVLYGNVSVGAEPFHLEGTGQLTFMVTSKAGAIVGKVGGADAKPVAKHSLILVPDSFNARSSMMRLLESESDDTGAFAFRNLAPGKYRLMVLKDQRLNTVSIAGQMADGQTVEVAPSATSVVTVTSQ